MTITEIIGDIDRLFADTRVSKQQTLADLKEIESHLTILKDALLSDIRREEEEVGEGQ